MLKILLIWQKECAIIGIAPQQHPINERSLIALLMDSSAIVSIGAYFFVEATTFREYAESIFVGTAMIAIAVDYAIALSKMRLLFDFVNDAEQIIEESEFQKCVTEISTCQSLAYTIICDYDFDHTISGHENPNSNAIYTHADQTIEKITKILFFVSIKIFYPIVVMPIYIFKFYLYFASDMDNDAFQMPFPYW